MVLNLKTRYQGLFLQYPDLVFNEEDKFLELQCTQYLNWYFKIANRKLEEQYHAQYPNIEDEEPPKSTTDTEVK